MTKNKVQKLLIPSFYLIAVSLIIGSIVLITTSLNKYLTVPKDYDYSLNGMFENTVPVINSETSIIRPYLSETVSIGKYFYDFESDKTKQESALIYYENTYMQNSGVDYISDTVFDIVSILPGTIIKVETDSTLGNIIQIKHDNDIISVYQGLDNVTLKEGEKVNQGDIIGTSGTSKINTSYTTSLHFEIYYKGALIDPENFYSLNIQDL